MGGKKPAAWATGLILVEEQSPMDESINPTHLYHYTTAGGLKSIIENQEIWATDIFYLNDWMEFHHGKEMFIGQIEQMLPSIKDDLQNKSIRPTMCIWFDGGG